MVDDYQDRNHPIWTMYYFLGYLLFTALVLLFVFYIYGFNIFTMYVLPAVLTIINSFALTRSSKLPIFKIAIMFFLLMILNSKVSIHIVEWTNNFYEPTILWTLLMTVSIPVGITSSLGRYGSGRSKMYIQNYANLILLLLMVTAFIFNWWKGGLVYLIIRIPMMLFELSITKTILYNVIQRNEQSIDQAP